MKTNESILGFRMQKKTVTYITVAMLLLVSFPHQYFNGVQADDTFNPQAGLHVTSENTPYTLDLSSPQTYDYIIIDPNTELIVDNNDIESFMYLTVIGDVWINGTFTAQKGSGPIEMIVGDELYIAATGSVDISAYEDDARGGGYSGYDVNGRGPGGSQHGGQHSDISGAGYATNGEETGTGIGYAYGYADLRHWDNESYTATNTYRDETYAQTIGGSAGASSCYSSSPTREGGGGGGAIKITAEIITNEGTIKANGDHGKISNEHYIPGCGSGGTIWLRAPKIITGGTIEAIGGVYTGSREYCDPGEGADGRIRLDYVEYLSTIQGINPVPYNGTLEIPSISNPYPANGAIGEEYNPQLSVNITDAQNDLNSVCFQTNASGTWQTIREEVGTLPNGIYTANTSDFYEKNTKYYWRLIVEDIEENTHTYNFNFTTGTVTVHHPIPGNAQENVRYNPTVSFELDNQVEARIYIISFYTNTSGSWEEMGKFTGTSLPNMRHYLATDAFNQQNTTYYWKVELKDSYNNIYNQIYEFKTAKNYTVGSGTETVDCSPWEWPDGNHTSREISFNQLTVESGATLQLNSDDVETMMGVYVYKDCIINGTLTAQSGSGPIELQVGNNMAIGSSGNIALSASQYSARGGGYSGYEKNGRGPGGSQYGGQHSDISGAGYATNGEETGTGIGYAYGYADLRHWDNESYTATNTYRDETYAQTIGGSAGGRCGNQESGGGGGAIKITAEIITNEGTIKANGDHGKTNNEHYIPGCGSGGTIWLQAPILNNSGSIEATGGVYTGSRYYCDPGDGADGRIRVDYGQKDDTGTIDPTPYEGDGVILLNHPRDDEILASTEYVVLNVSVYFGTDVDVNFVDGSDDTTIQSFSDIGNGESVEYNWTGLDSGTTYTWYVEVNDEFQPTGDTFGPMDPGETSDEWEFTTQTDQEPPAINSFTIDATNNIDDDNNDIQIDWSVFDVNGDLIDLYFSFGKGQIPDNPTVSAYDAHIVNVANTETNYDLDWENNTTEWGDYNGTVYVKMIAYDGNYSDPIYYNLSGIDGTVPFITYNTAEQTTFELAPTLDIDFKDNISFRKAQYKIDSGGEWKTICNYQSGNYTTNWAIDDEEWVDITNGIHYMYFKVIDAAGNEYITADNDEAFNFTKDAILNSFTLHNISGWDDDNNDILCSWNLVDDSADLYFTFKVGSSPNDPSPSNQYAMISDAGDQTEYDIEWVNESNSWVDTSDTVYVKVNASISTDSKVYEFIIPNGIDGSPPTLTDVLCRPDGFSDTGEKDDDTEIFITYSAADSLSGVEIVYAELNTADPTEEASGSGQDTDTGVIGNNTYYVKAVDVVGNYIIANDTIDIVGPPTITTNTTTDIHFFDATMHGYVSDDGGENCTVDFEYGTESGIYTANTTDQDIAGGNTFSINQTGLTDNTQYYYRSRATNYNGTSYGSEMTFTTINAVQYNTPSIPDGATDVPISTETWSIDISDEHGTFNWSIETSPDIGSASADNEDNGTKSCALTELYYSTTYIVYVNVTGSERNDTYNFTTQSGPEDKIDVILSPQGMADIKLNRTSWMPSIGITQNISTDATAFNLDNNGSISVDVTINISNTANWTAATTPGHNQFNMSYTIGSGWTILQNTQQAFVDNFAYNEDQDFGLQLFMPTSTETSTNQTATITFVATVD